MTAVAPTPVIGCGLLRVDGYVCVGEDCDGVRHFLILQHVCACGVACAGDEALRRHQLDCYIE